MTDTIPTVAHAIAYRVPGDDTRVDLGRLHKTEDCAIRGIPVFEGRRVIGLATIALMLHEDISGMEFLLRHVQGAGTPAPALVADDYESMHAQLLSFLGAKDHVDAAAIIGRLHGAAYKTAAELAEAGPSGWYATVETLAAEWDLERDVIVSVFSALLPFWMADPTQTHLWLSIDNLILRDDYGVDGSDFYQCRLCNGESGAGLLNKGIAHYPGCPLHEDNFGSLVGPGLPKPFDLIAHLYRQRDWSEATFGPGERTAGVVDHIRKELVEVEAAAGDISEWIDVVILALDGAWRSGATPEQIVAALTAKQAKNEGRTWPDWRTADPSKAIEHDRSADAEGAHHA